MTFSFTNLFRYILITLFSALYFTATSQVLIDSSYKVPEKEKLHYRIYYKLGNFWVNAAFANFFTDTLSYEGKTVYKFYVEAYTREKYNWIYSLEDHYKSYTDYNNFKPLKFKEHNIERGVIYDAEYNFNWDNKNVEMKIYQSGEDTVYDEKKLPGFVTDPLSAIYYIRKIDFGKYKQGDKISFNTILGDKIFTQTLVYRGTDILKDTDGNEHSTYVLEALIKNSSFFSKKDGVLVWITGDNRRLIAKVEAKIIVGSIIVYLRQNDISFDTH